MLILIMTEQMSAGSPGKLGEGGILRGCHQHWCFGNGSRTLALPSGAHEPSRLVQLCGP